MISGYVGARYRRINRGIQAGVASMAQAAEEVLSAQQEVKIYGAQAGRDRALSRARRSQPAPATSRSRPRAPARRRWCRCWPPCALAVILLVAGQRSDGRAHDRRQLRVADDGDDGADSLAQAHHQRAERGAARHRRRPSACSRCSTSPTRATPARMPLARSRGEIEFVGVRRALRQPGRAARWRASASAPRPAPSPRSSAAPAAASPP